MVFMISPVQIDSLWTIQEAAEKGQQNFHAPFPAIYIVSIKDIWIFCGRKPIL